MNSLASTKCASRLLMALAAISGIFLTVGCGSSNPITPPNSNGFSNSNFSGTYVLSISGEDVNLNAQTESFFTIVGTVMADGKGGITGGTVDINDPDLGGVFTGQTVGASTYSVSQDGRGTGTLKTPQGNFALDFVLTSNSHGLVTRFDGNGTGSGTLDTQGSASQSSLVSLAFSLSGADVNQAPLGTVGAFTLNSSGTITPSGLQDFNDSGTSGSFTNLPMSGSLVLTSSTAGTAQFDSSFGSLLFDVWVIDSTHLKLIETDGSGLALSGDAFTQQNSFPAGQLVFTLAGLDSGFAPLVAGGIVTTDVNGNLSNGTEDYNDVGTTNTVTGLSGSCTAFAAGRCQLALTGFSNGNLNNFIFAAYPSSGGIQLLEIDNLGILQGAAYAQIATSFAASQSYGLNLTGSNSNGEVDDIAQFNTTSTNVSGVLDENDIATLLLSNVSLSGTYSAPTSGRGSINVPNINTFNGTLNLEYYVVDASTILIIEGDGGQATVGTFQLQASGSGALSQSRLSLAHPAMRSHGAFRHN